MPRAAFDEVRCVAEPGLPAHRVELVSEALHRTLGLPAPESDEPVVVDWLPLNEHAPLDPQALERLHLAQPGASEHPPARLTILLTDTPRWIDRRLVVAEGHPELGVVVVSFPGLGPRITAERITEVIALVLQATTVRRRGGWRSIPLERGHAVVRATWVGPFVALTGMIRTNQPWKVALRLKRATVAGLATSAFGVFYTTVWQMSDRLSLLRLLGISTCAVAVFGGWLALSHGLQGSKRTRSARSRTQRTAWQLSTFFTVAVSVLTLYLYLLVLVLLLAWVVIDPGFLGQQLGHPASPGSYVRLALFSSALGLLAGSLGTGFDADTETASLTHPQRAQRRAGNTEPK